MEARGFNREHRSGATLTAAVDPGGPVTSRDVVIDRRARTVMLRQPLVLDLGAVAKGLAVDLAARELSGLRDFAIDAGGDLYLSGLNDAGAPWAIGIQDPDRAGEIIEVRHLTDIAICTSGGYERTTSATGEHHLLDPRTGCSPRTLASATVLASSAMVADALATAAFVLGPSDGLRFLETQQVEGLLIGSDGARHRTRSRS
jgi:thiamine biosynthesis lipoprotein